MYITVLPPGRGLVARLAWITGLVAHLLGIGLGPLTAQVLVTAGLLCVALHLAGIGSSVRVRGYTRRR